MRERRREVTTKEKNEANKKTKAAKKKDLRRI
jgi:hypothetical protein